MELVPVTLTSGSHDSSYRTINLSKFKLVCKHSKQKTVVFLKMYYIKYFQKFRLFFYCSWIVLLSIFTSLIVINYTNHFNNLGKGEY